MLFKCVQGAFEGAPVDSPRRENAGSSQNGEISVKHFIALNTAADNQRERLMSAPLSATAYKLIEEIVTASEKRLGYLAWAMYGDNQPSHPIHTLSQVKGRSCRYEGDRQSCALSKLKDGGVNL
jgi:hypothetical protein